MSSDTRKPSSGTSIDGSGQNLTERAELISDGGLEVEAELNLGNWRNHIFPVLSGTGQKKSGSLVVSEDIRPKVVARNFLVCNVFDRRPVFGGNQALTAQPIGNGLLADGWTLHEAGDSIRESNLTASDANCALKSDNVRFLHDYRRYTTQVVHVNNLADVPKNKTACIVRFMAVAQERHQVQPKRERIAVRGPDGMTLGERLVIAMKARGRASGKEYRPRDLLLECQKLVGRPVITQQGLSLILTNQTSESPATAAFAAVLGVNDLWLQYGIGPVSFIDSMAKTAR